MGMVRQILALVLAVTLLGCGPALAGRRVALVIGNSAYRNVPKLTNPARDAALLADMFRHAGFDAVTTKVDLDANEMRKTLREFGARARDADMAVIFYAGHGIELDGNNYLIPVDATLETDADVLDETLPLDRVLFAVEPAKKLRLVILDACRDNPFAKTMKRTLATRAVGRGLAMVEPGNPNTLIAFAAKAGSTASDGESGNSPFAAALVEYLPRPGLDLRRAFGFVRDDVLKNTGYRQEPYVYGSLGGDDLPIVPAKPAVAGPQPNPDDAVRRDYELALQLGTRDGWSAFLGRYPAGFYADLAKGQLNKIAAEDVRAQAAEKARLAEQEKARLAAEGARKAEQDRAAAEARAAEEARLAAEKAKEIAQAKAAAAEQARLAAEKALSEKAAAEKVESDQRAAAAPVADAPAAEGDVTRKQAESQKVATLSPPADVAAAPSGADLVKSVQSELRRVGCLAASADGEWNAASQRSLTLFNRYAGTRFDAKLASVEALDAIRTRSSRVCPLACDRGFRADGERCVKIVCRPGYGAGDDGSCQRIEGGRPTAKRDSPEKPEPVARRQVQTSAQSFCRNGICREVRKGCHVESVGPQQGGTYVNGQVEVCP